MQMNYGSVCSGVEAASLAWEHLGWKPVFFSEVEPFPAAVLMQRFGATKPLRPLDPAQASDEKDRKTRLSWQKQIAELPEGGTVPNLGDFTLIKKDDYNGQIDLIVGGTPCQDLSIAGKRLGFEGRRSVLALDFVRLCFETGTRWVCWENVPATLSSNNGKDFARFLSLLCGWEVPVPSKGWGKAGIVTNAPGHFGLAFRVLDAQYTRVEQFPRAIPQRRRRVILVGSLGSWEDCAKVLFDGEMCGGDTPPSRTTRQATAGGSGKVAQGACRDMCWWDGTQKADTLTTRSLGQLMPDKHQLPCVVDTRWHSFADDGSCPSLLATDYKEPKAVCDPCPTLDASYPGKQNNQDNSKYVCYPIDVMNIDGRNLKAKCFDEDGESAYSLTRRRPSGVCTPGIVRRLLPIECERLMGFPDGWTKIPWRKKSADDCPDGPRYKALGNSMCVNVMAWIGERIAKYG